MSTILDFKEGPENLAKCPDILTKGHVFKVPSLPSLEHLSELVKVGACPECHQIRLRLLGYETSDKIGGFVGRCLSCQKPVVAFFSDQPLWSGDILVVRASSKDETYSKELDSLQCSSCNARLEVLYRRESEAYDIQRVLPMQAQCPTCTRLVNIIFWDSPEYYFHQALRLADEVIPHSSRAGLVFLVAAMEAFFQKAFLFQSTTNQFLIERRKINFQSLQETREFYIKFMDLDLKNYVSEADWGILTKAVQDRHGLIHNAGFDRRFRPIVVKSGDLPLLRGTISVFIGAMKSDLEAKGFL
jgi:hypothetical protein